MPFEIRDLYKAIDASVLNKQAADVWGQPIQYMGEDELLVCPPNEPEENWTKVIGHAIEYPMLFREHVMQQDWKDVKQTLFNIQIEELADQINLSYKQELLHKISEIHAFLKPYYDLIDTWDACGYIPIRTT